MRWKGQYHFKGHNWQDIYNIFIALQGEKLICCIYLHWEELSLENIIVKAFSVVRTHNSAFLGIVYSLDDIVRVRT